VQARRASGFDWRNAAAYAPLLDADRSLIAWEWLRRDPRYIEAAAGSSRRTGRSAAEFGLVDFEPPELAVPDARPLWSEDADPYVLRVTRGGDAGAEDEFELNRFSAIATLVAREDSEHLLLCDGFRTLRLDGPPGTFGERPVCLRYMLEGVAAADRALMALRRFLALCRSGCLPRSLWRREPRARRWVLMLRTWDALTAGADQREIAGELLSRTAVAPRWRSREPSVRSQAQRLVRLARLFSAGGYRVLLGR
jgi:hypothetical protein